ncbi:hypothetical protein [Algibacter mikhailovii]|uniref:HTH luxR-type domain-containing protein n=1 Tax=Algibacter mikhailovii TaxID=425498 RepID=A0A918QTU1_9FLAO|nr:hypothetical protein [Algibacter mikhailovii]GGZ67943.1 hypothetical protein GCM10007028_01070 [Algibacter mikhailovii]
MGSAQESLSAKKAFDRALEIRYKNPDSSIFLFEKSYNEYLELNDTIPAIQALFQKAFVYETRAEYAKSYDVLWKALLIMDNMQNDGLKAQNYHRLGRIYSYYKREDTSIEFQKKALQLQKEILKKNNEDDGRLSTYYYFIAATYRELNKPELGKVYLDSSYTYFKENKSYTPKAFLDFENAFYLSKSNKGQEAIKTMERIAPWFENNRPSYLVLFYKYWGDFYLDLNNLKKSKEFYLKSLKVSSDYKSHIDFTPLVYEKLSEVSLLSKDYKMAFEYINKAKELDRLFFDSRSPENRTLLEIKDDYRLEKEKQQKLIQTQHLRQLQQEDEIKNLQRIILFASIVFILIIGYFYIKNIRTKHQIEKQLIKKNKELEIKKAKELLELKNRELAASALQLIEKEEFLKDLKIKVREGDSTIKKSELNKILRSVSINNTITWEEFRLRFIEVNKEFYDKIFEKFPNLSQGDQKICALIKLNMSSKEMSKLLGISVESVHTSRHRIRKKMELSREVNLEDFINSL